MSRIRVLTTSIFLFAIFLLQETVVSRINFPINGVSVYTNSSQIKKGIGDFSSQNIAVSQVYERLIKEKVLGISTTIHLYNHKMNKETFQIQLTKVLI
jgi:hypothetical protein